MNPSRKTNVYLAGMIGVGKTTIGQALARVMGVPFYDFDWELNKHTGLDLHTLVREQGWLGFRVAEYAVIKQLAAVAGAVVGLGGGTVRYQWNLDAMAGTGPIVLLTADLGVLAERVRVSDRPRVNPGTTLEEDLDLIWRNGKDLYLKAATYTYPTDKGLTAEQEAHEIAALVRDWTVTPVTSSPKRVQSSS
jgi:shikimate kinase